MPPRIAVSRLMMPTLQPDGWRKLLRNLSAPRGQVSF